MSEPKSMDGQPARVRLFDAVRFTLADATKTVDPQEYGFIKWQHGPIQDNGRNGILLEELLERVIIPRLRGFNRPTLEDGSENPFQCRENSLAITHLEEALHWLWHRTRLRQLQGVEGRNIPHVSE